MEGQGIEGRSTLAGHIDAMPGDPLELLKTEVPKGLGDLSGLLKGFFCWSPLQRKYKMLHA